MLLNSAGPLKSPEEDDPATDANPSEPPAPWWQGASDAVVDAVKRVVLFFAFQRARQPARIREGGWRQVAKTHSSLRAVLQMVLPQRSRHWTTCNVHSFHKSHAHQTHNTPHFSLRSPRNGVHQ